MEVSVLYELVKIHRRPIMSRTYRAAMLPIDCNCGAPIGWIWRLEDSPSEEVTEKERSRARRKGVSPHRCCRCWTNRKFDYFSKRNHKRDNKPKENSNRTYKKVYNRSRRAKVRNAMRHEKYDCIPIFRTNNDFRRHWDYW